MAETFTNDNTPDTEVLTPEEEDSLAVGEKLVAEQEGLLAGKYKNAEDLEAAYIALQQKLGQGKSEPEEPEETESEAKQEETEPDKEKLSEASPAVALINEASSEFYSNDGSLSDKTISKFSSMSSTDLVNAYLEIQKNNPQSQNAAPVEMSDAQVNQVKNAAGGEAEYGKVLSWAAKNLESSKVDAYDSVIDSGNLQAINIAFQGLKAEYDNANGYEGRMLQGKPANNKGDLYRSQAELVRAMSDPRYENDPAYRADVISKLEQSDLNF